MRSTESPKTIGWSVMHDEERVMQNYKQVKGDVEETQLVHVTVRDEHVLVKSHCDSNGHVSIVSGGRVTNK